MATRIKKLLLKVLRVGLFVITPLGVAIHAVYPKMFRDAFAPDKG